MENKLVTKDTVIGEIVNEHPEAAEILLGIGMHCLGCPAAQAETLEEACAVHGVDPDVIAKAINEVVAAKG
ncbi:MAG: DUF1858 domain-containing protein [Clostridia bacterium]|nr:DUF1858 domain-containing protein [Clostridia bacterium]